MNKLILLGAVVALSGCETTGSIANCANGVKLRSAALATIALIDKACPFNAETSETIEGKAPVVVTDDTPEL